MRFARFPSFVSGTLLVLFGGFSACSMVAEPSAPSPQPPVVEPGRDVSAPRSGSRLPRSPSSYRALPTPEEVRGLWVVRTTLASPDSIRLMADRVADAGFNTVLIQVRGRGEAYYRSRWEPPPEGADAADEVFDPLELAIREAHTRGLAVHAWVNTHLVGGIGDLPSDPQHIINRRPDLLAVPRELATELFPMDPEDPAYVRALLSFAQEHSDRIEGIYTSPSSPEVKEHVYSIWMDLAEAYELDGIHFDYVRYPNPDFDYSRGALERFRAWVIPRLPPGRQSELDRAYQLDPLAYVDALPGPWDEFRREQISDLVERVYFGVKKRRPDLVVSAAVFANADDAYRTRFQDWRAWVTSGFLDAVAPMAYTADDGTFAEQIGAAVDAVGGDKVWAGIGAYQNSVRGTLDKIGIAERLGSRGVLLFSYDWAAHEGESDGTRSYLQQVGAEAFRRR